MHSYPGLLDLVRDGCPELVVLVGIFASGQDLDGETAALELLQMLGCRRVSVNELCAAMP